MPCAATPRSGHRGHPALLPHERDADLLRVGDRVQPAGDRPLGAQLQVRQLLRLVRRPAPERVRPEGAGAREFASIEEICNYLLGHKEVVDYVRARGRAARRVPDVRRGDRGSSPRELGLEVAFPTAALRHRLDSKIETTRLGNEAGVPERAQHAGSGDRATRAAAPWPRGAGSATTWSCRRRTATPARPRSSSRSRTTGQASGRRSSASEHQGDAADRAARGGDRGRDHAPRDAGGAADDGAHRLPGADPVRRRLVRQRRVAATFSAEAQRRAARERTKAMGERLRQEGYRGYFELDFLARRRHRRDVAGRAEPAGDRREQR